MLGEHTAKSERVWAGAMAQITGQKEAGAVFNPPRFKQIHENADHRAAGFWQRVLEAFLRGATSRRGFLAPERKAPRPMRCAWPLRKRVKVVSSARSRIRKRAGQRDSGRDIGIMPTCCICATGIREFLKHEPFSIIPVSSFYRMPIGHDRPSSEPSEGRMTGVRL